MFALILCLTAGIHPIITSSSDRKLERIKKLASPQSISTVNYKTQNVAQEVLKLTDGKGVDLVVNTIGAASLSHDLEVLRRRGTVSLVGFLSETPQNLDSRIFTNILLKNATVQ
jgi:NADPH:quinone reductase-like Zn-dependent oxidoreductase